MFTHGKVSLFVWHIPTTRHFQGLNVKHYMWKYMKEHLNTTRIYKRTFWINWQLQQYCKCSVNINRHNHDLVHNTALPSCASSLLHSWHLEVLVLGCLLLLPPHQHHLAPRGPHCWDRCGAGQCSRRWPPGHIWHPPPEVLSFNTIESCTDPGIPIKTSMNLAFWSQTAWNWTE